MNTDLEDQPEKVNEDAFGEGWLCKMSFAEPAELGTLLDAGAYEELKNKLMRSAERNIPSKTPCREPGNSEES